MSNQNISLQELSEEIGNGWAKALKVYANVKDDLDEKPKDEWLRLLDKLKLVKTNLK